MPKKRDERNDSPADRSIKIAASKLRAEELHRSGDRRSIKNSKVMNPGQQGTLWIGAFRYYLGRRTYAVSDFVELLILEWGNLPCPLKKLITTEFLIELKKDDELRSDPACSSLYYPLGQDCDRREWEKLLPLLEREQRQELAQAIDQQNK